MFSQIFTFPDYSDEELHTILKGIVSAEPRFLLEHARYGAIAARRLGRQRGTNGFGNARAVRNFWEQVTARQASRVVEQRGSGLEPDPWLITRDDMLGPRELDLSRSSALKELESMRGLAMVKDEVGI